MIPQANLGSDLQTEVPTGITGLAASIAMVGSPYRTVIEHRTGPTEVTIEDRMERPACRVVAAQHAMVYRLVSPGALGHDTFFVKHRFSRSYNRHFEIRF
jgi:hypothetical protein